MILEVVRNCKGKGLICDEWVEWPDAPLPPVLCGEPAVLQVDFSGAGDSLAVTFCVRHAQAFVSRINSAIVESTEEG